jgi:hypothetical protein
MTTTPAPASEANQLQEPLEANAKIWKCACEQIRFKLEGAPICTVNCHCHSCVASERYVRAKGGNGTSSFVDPGTNDGIAVAGYYLSKVIPLTDMSASSLGFVQGGAAGKVVRTYTKCCNTMCVSGGGSAYPVAFRPFNRNCIYNTDGTLYDAGKKVVNIQAKHSFHPRNVPAPRHSTLPFKEKVKVVGGMCAKSRFCCCPSGFGDNADELAFVKNPRDVTEIVPITWNSTAQVTGSDDLGRTTTDTEVADIQEKSHVTDPAKSGAGAGGKVTGAVAGPTGNDSTGAPSAVQVDSDCGAGGEVGDSKDSDIRLQ